MSKFKIAAYLRVSTEEQAALVDGSLDNQKYRISAFVDLKNVQEKSWGSVVDYYVDDGYSAKDMNRPAFQKMMSDLRKGKVDLILVNDLSRLSRSISDFCMILDVLKNHESSFLSIKEQFDSSSPAGKMMLYNMINLAQFEREQTAERVALGCHARAMRGLLNGGVAILGYDKSLTKKNSYEVNKDEAKIARQIFKIYLEQGTLSRAINRFNELDIKPKVNDKRKQRLVDRGTWTHTTLKRLLNNYAYVGLMEVNKTKSKANIKNLKPHEKHQLVKASWPAIVSENDFYAVQELLKQNFERERARLSQSERRVFLLSGIIQCKECGRAMVGHSAHGEKSVHRYYKHASSVGDEITCSVKRISADEVENVVGKHIFKLLDEAGYLSEVSKRIFSLEKESYGSKRTIKQNYVKEIARIANEMEHAFKLQMNAGSNAETMKFVSNKIEELGKSKAAMQEKLNSMNEIEDNIISFEDVNQNLKDRVLAVTRGWAKMPEFQKKKALQRLIHRICVSENRLDINYYYNSLKDENALGVFSISSGSTAKVITLTDKKKAAISADSNSKLWVENCLSYKMVMPEGFEPSTYSLEGNCSIQLS